MPEPHDLDSGCAPVHGGQTTGGEPAGDAARCLACLGHIAQKLAPVLPSAEIGRICVEECRNALGAPGGALMLLRPAGGPLDLVYATDGFRIPHTLALCSDHPLACACRERRTVCAGEPSQAPPDGAADRYAPYDGPLTAVPVLDEGQQPLGTLCIAAPCALAADQHARSLLQTVGLLCGQALGRAAAREAAMDAQEEAVRERAARSRSEVRLARVQGIIDSTRHAIIACDHDDHIVFWSKGAEQLYGYAESEALGCAASMLVPEDCAQEAAEMGRVVRSGQRVEGVETSRVARDGRRLVVCLDEAPILNRDGAFAGSVSIADDITDRKRAQDQRERLMARLRGERARMFAVLDQLPAGVVMAEAPSGRVVLANREASRILLREPLSAHTIADYVHWQGFGPDGSPIVPEDYPLARALLSGDQLVEQEVTFRRGDGRLATVVANAAPVRGADGEVVAAVMAFVDISAHKQVASDLQATEDRFRTAVDHFPGVFVIYDDRRRMQFVNEYGCRLAGAPESAMLGRRDEDLYPTQVTAGYIGALEASISSGEPRSVEWSASDVPGGRTFETDYVPLLDEGGRVRQVLAISHDITDRKEVEGALRALAESSPQMVWTMDAEGHCDYTNRNWTAYTGLVAAQMTMPEIDRVIHPDDIQGVRGTWNASLRSGDPFHAECRLRSAATGEYRWFLSRALAVRNAGGQIARWYGTTTDVHDLKRAMAEIETLNRRLQTGMRETHHRIKNNLQVIAALVDMQVTSGASAVPISELERMGRHVRGLASVHDMLTQEAASRGRTDHLHLKTALERLAPVLDSVAAGRGIELEADDIVVPVRLGTALVVLINELVSNAVKHGAGPVGVSLRRTDQGGEMEVTDHGPGFPPGFDARAQAHTGLDLVDMVGRHDLQGQVAYGNRPGGGARVSVTFPLQPANDE